MISNLIKITSYILSSKEISIYLLGLITYHAAPTTDSEIAAAIPKLAHA